MLLATLAIRRDLRRARGLLRAANVIAGPTEFLTLTVWTDRDAMRAFMSSGAHERIMWRWPELFSAFWLGRFSATEREAGAWRGLRVGRLAARGTAVRSDFIPPSFASRDPRPRDLEPLHLAATTTIHHGGSADAWIAGIRSWRDAHGRVRADPRVLVSAAGLSLDGELAMIAVWRDEAAASAAVPSLARDAAWSMAWRAVDEFGMWDGRRLRKLAAARAASA
jgi:hypothetical protein